MSGVRAHGTSELNSTTEDFWLIVTQTVWEIRRARRHIRGDARHCCHSPDLIADEAWADGQAGDHPPNAVPWTMERPVYVSASVPSTTIQQQLTKTARSFRTRCHGVAKIFVARTELPGHTEMRVCLQSPGTPGQPAATATLRSACRAPSCRGSAPRHSRRSAASRRCAYARADRLVPDRHKAAL